MKEVILFYGYKFWIWETSKDKEEIKAEAKANLYHVVAIRETDAPRRTIEPKLKKNDLNLRRATKDYIKENFTENEIESSYQEEILGSLEDRQIEKLQKENIELQRELDECDKILSENEQYNERIENFIAWTKTVNDEILMELLHDTSTFEVLYKKYEPFITEYLERR